MEIINYDVLIPARDEENNIKKTLESINNQTIKPNSVIVVNDNSQDNTEKIATSAGVKVVNFPYQHKNWVTSGKLGIVFSFGMNFFNKNRDFKVKKNTFKIANGITIKLFNLGVLTITTLYLSLSKYLTPLKSVEIMMTYLVFK